MARDFRGLRVWEESMVLVEAVYGIAGRFPSEERYGLASQLKRAAVSIPSCIAEGNARGSTKDYLRFLSMTKGSLAEVQTQLLLAARLGLVEAKLVDLVLKQATTVSLLLQSLRKSLISKLERTSSSRSTPPLHIPALHSRS